MKKKWIAVLCTGFVLLSGLFVTNPEDSKKVGGDDSQVMMEIKPGG